MGCTGSSWHTHLGSVAGAFEQQEATVGFARCWQHECVADFAWQRPQHWGAAGFHRGPPQQSAEAGATLAANSAGVSSHANQRIDREELRIRAFHNPQAVNYKFGRRTTGNSRVIDANVKLLGCSGPAVSSKGLTS